MLGPNEIKERAIANGDQVLSSFGGSIPPLDLNNLEKGDVFTIPTNFEVFAQKIGDNTVEYTIVTLDNGAAKKFFPSMLTKRRAVCSADGELTGEWKHSLGTVVDDFQKYTTIQAGMEALKGKKIKISDSETVKCLQYGTDKVVNTNIFTFDYND